jgi:Short C-terminal domain/Phospholipase_D-nuclease N-terminal
MPAAAYCCAETGAAAEVQVYAAPFPGVTLSADPTTIMMVVLLPGPMWPGMVAGAPQGKGEAMVLADSSYSYPLLGAFWTIIEIFLWVLWFWVLITVFIDIFRSHDLSGWGKALWFLFVLIIPLIGVLVYLIVRGGKMHERMVQQAQQQDQQFRDYVQDAAGSQSPADQLAKLADLRDRGVITNEEFERQKAKILA